MGLSALDVTVTYRNGHTALWNASFDIPRGTYILIDLSAVVFVIFVSSPDYRLIRMVNPDASLGHYLRLVVV